MTRERLQGEEGRGNERGRVQGKGRTPYILEQGYTPTFVQAKNKTHYSTAGNSRRQTTAPCTLYAVCGLTIDAERNHLHFSRAADFFLSRKLHAQHQFCATLDTASAARCLRAAKYFATKCHRIRFQTPQIGVSLFHGIALYKITNRHLLTYVVVND